MGDNMTLNLVSEITTTIGELNTKIEKQDKAIIGIFSYVSTFLDKLKDLLYNNDENDTQDNQEEVEDEQTVSTQNNNNK